MIEIKRDIIQEEGVPVSILNKDMDLIEDTVALIGRATKQFVGEISLESHRQGQFLPELDIRNGLIVRNEIANEDYIIVANYPEILERQKCVTIARMLVCNSKMTVRRLVEDADIHGNIKREFKDIYKDLSIYVEALGSEVKQTNPGKFPQMKCNIFAPDVVLDIEDQIQVEMGGGMAPFKLEGYDYLTFKGLTLIEVITETRR